jgi:hypothetical protein
VQVQIAPRLQEHYFAVHFETARLVLAKIEEFEREDRLRAAAVSRQQEAVKQQQLAALFQIAMGTVRNLVATSALFLRLDYSMFVFDRLHRTERTIDLAGQRAHDLEHIVHQRQQFARLKNLETLWPETLDQQTRKIISDSQQLIDAARAQRQPPPPRLDVDEAVIRILPLMAPGVAVDSSAPQEVLDFCSREGILDDVVHAVDIVLNRSFPTALSVALEVVNDPDCDEQYLVLSAMVPALKAREQYADYISACLEKLTPVGLEKIRFLYDAIQPAADTNL